MFTEAQNTAIVKTELDRVFFQNFQYSNTNPGIATAGTGAIFKPMQIQTAAYVENIYKGPGLFDQIGETQTVPSSVPQTTNKLTTYVKDFAKGIELSKDLFDDNMHGVWARTVSEMAQMARITQDQNAFAFFNGAFTTSLTADGVAICGTHTLISGDTQGNYGTGTGSALSESTLWDGIVNLRQQKNQAGVVMGSVPSVLLVPSKLFKLAVQLTESALVPGSSAAGQNDINVYRSAYGLEVYTSPYLDAVAGGSDTAWFLLAPNHSITRVIRQGIQTSLRSWEYSNNRTYFYQANFRETVYAPDYVGVYGAAGA